MINILEFKALFCLFFRGCAPALCAATFFAVFVVAMFLATVLALLAGSTVSLGAFLFLACPWSCSETMPILAFHF